MTLRGISSYLAKSGVRCRELKHNLIVCTFPNIFEIRWNEFTHQLVESILKSWNALLIYFNSTICMKPVDFQRIFAMQIIFIYYALWPMY